MERKTTLAETHILVCKLSMVHPGVWHRPDPNLQHRQGGVKWVEGVQEKGSLPLRLSMVGPGIEHLPDPVHCCQQGAAHQALLLRAAAQKGP